MLFGVGGIFTAPTKVKTVFKHESLGTLSKIVVDDIKLQSTKIFFAVSQKTFQYQFDSLVIFSTRLDITQGLNNGCWIGLVLRWYMLFGSVVFIRLDEARYNSGSQ